MTIETKASLPEVSPPNVSFRSLAVSNRAFPRISCLIPHASFSLFLVYLRFVSQRQKEQEKGIHPFFLPRGSTLSGSTSYFSSSLLRKQAQREDQGLDGEEEDEEGSSDLEDFIVKDDEIEMEDGEARDINTEENDEDEAPAGGWSKRRDLKRRSKCAEDEMEDMGKDQDVGNAKLAEDEEELGTLVSSRYGRRGRLNERAKM